MTFVLLLGLNNQISVPEIYSYTGKVKEKSTFLR